MNIRTNAGLASIEAKINSLCQMRELPASLAFGCAVAAIENACETLICTGMGKSGHVARKLAATFQSTGQRAVFMHPAEAAHGDMGLVRHGDIVLMISNSGETDELIPVLEYAKSLDVGVILITSRPEAILAQQADIVLALPAVAEGDTIDKAPMASICCQLAAGDALAAALMAARGFTAADFAAIHHGGYLGRSLKAVA